MRSLGMHRMAALLALQLSWALVPDETPAIGEDIDVAAPLPDSRFKGTDAPPVEVSSEGTDAPPFELSFEGTDSGARRQLNHYSTRIDAGECIRLAHNESLYSERILSFIGFWVPEGLRHGSLPRAQGNPAVYNFMASRTYEEWAQDPRPPQAKLSGTARGPGPNVRCPHLPPAFTGGGAEQGTLIRMLRIYTI